MTTHNPHWSGNSVGGMRMSSKNPSVTARANEAVALSSWRCVAVKKTMVRTNDTLRTLAFHFAENRFSDVRPEHDQPKFRCTESIPFEIRMDVCSALHEEGSGSLW